jgi:hypothetical protein
VRTLPGRGKAENRVSQKGLPEILCYSITSPLASSAKRDLGEVQGGDSFFLPAKRSVSPAR